MCSRPLGACTSSPVPSRTRVAQGLLILYFVGSIAAALPLLFSLGRAGDLVNTTSGKILGAALLSLGVGALVAARDPWRNRVMIQVLILFTTPVDAGHHLPTHSRAPPPRRLLVLAARRGRRTGAVGDLLPAPAGELSPYDCSTMSRMPCSSDTSGA